MATMVDSWHESGTSCCIGSAEISMFVCLLPQEVAAMPATVGLGDFACTKQGQPTNQLDQLDQLQYSARTCMSTSRPLSFQVC